MTEKHKKGYQIVKYLLERLPASFVNYCHIKTIALRQKTSFADLSSKCMFAKIMSELHHAYEVGCLKAFDIWI